MERVRQPRGGGDVVLWGGGTTKARGDAGGLAAAAVSASDPTTVLMSPHYGLTNSRRTKPPRCPHQPQPRALRPAAFGRTDAGTVRLERRNFHGHARNATRATPHVLFCPVSHFGALYAGTRARESAWTLTENGASTTRQGGNNKNHREKSWEFSTCER